MVPGDLFYLRLLIGPPLRPVRLVRVREDGVPVVRFLDNPRAGCLTAAGFGDLLKGDTMPQPQPKPQPQPRSQPSSLSAGSARFNNRLEGTPIPEDWTLNAGPDTRPLEIDMEVRFPSGDVFQVVKTSPGGATIVGSGEVRRVAGKSFRSSRRLQVSRFSEIEYRRSRVDWEEEGMLYSVPDDEPDYYPVDPDDPDNLEGDRPMAKTKSKKKAAAASPVPGVRARKAKSAAPKTPREPKPIVLHPCVCGCGGETRRYFVPGHDARFKGWLRKIAKGEAEPEELMPADLVKALGPWKGRKGEGKVPSKTYQEAFPR